MIAVMTRGSLMELQWFVKSVPAEKYILMVVAPSLAHRNASSHAYANVREALYPVY
jgi:hypothetical protein